MKKLIKQLSGKQMLNKRSSTKAVKSLSKEGNENFKISKAINERQLHKNIPIIPSYFMERVSALSMLIKSGYHQAINQFPTQRLAPRIVLNPKPMRRLLQ